MANRLWAAALVLTLSAGQAQTKVWVVNANGTGDFTSLTAAIDSASSGDSIYVAPGGYSESPQPTLKKLTILGAGFNSPSAITWSITLNSALDLGAGSLIAGLELKGPANPLIRMSENHMTVEKCHLLVTVGQNVDGLVVDADSGVVRQNIIQGTFFSYNQANCGIKLGGQGHRGIRVTNNVVDNFDNCIRVFYSNGDDGVIANNILLKSNFGISIVALPGNTLFQGKVYSNMFQDNYYGYRYSDAGQFYSANNAYFGITQLEKPSFDTGSIIADPAFVNYSSATGYTYGASNMHLSASSPCIDAGEPNIGNDDRDGSRNDIGIYGGPDQFDDSGAPIDPSVITVVVSPYAAPLNGTITIKVLGRIGQ